MSQPGRSLFGVGVEALLETGANGGTLIPGSDTQIKNANVSGNTRKNIVHQENGGATADAHTFNFTWTAPSTNVGDVTFYVAANAANGNGLKTGDWIYTTSELVTSTFTGVTEEIVRPMAVRYDAFNTKLILDYNLSAPSSIEAHLYTLDGKEVMDLMHEAMPSGNSQREVSLSELQPGTYLVVVKGDGLDSVVEKLVR
jgi:hypothetical protein